MEDDFSMMKANLTFSSGGSQVDYDILGTTLNMRGVSGTVVIDPQWVRVNDLKGNIWGGFFQGKIGVQIDKGDAIDGALIAKTLDLSQIGKSYGVDSNKAWVEASNTIRAQHGRQPTIKAQVTSQLSNGNLVEVPIFGKLVKAIGNFIPGLNHLTNYNLTRASCDYYIDKGFIRTDHFSASGTNMALEGTGSVNLQTLMVDSDMQLSFRGLPSLLTLPVYILAKGLFKVKGKGPLNDVDWSLSPFSSGKN